MITKRRACLASGLLLANIVFFYTWSFVLNVGLWPPDNHSSILAEDMLRTACESVRVAMQSLLVAYEDEFYAASNRNAMARGLATKLERLQVSFGNFDHEQPFRDITLEEPSRSQSVHQPRPGTTNDIDLCESLAGKRIAMIGGEHIYRLHVLFLQHRERTERKSFPCLYHEFCTHHRICLPNEHVQADALSSRYVKLPTAQELIDTESAAINYIVSDTLRSTRNESSWVYNLPFVDQTTGVRLRETYWLAAARRANVIIFGRGPLSAPAETYMGNWSFLHNTPDYMNQSRAGIRSRDDIHMGQLVPRSVDLLNAAVHLTVSRFLPDVFQLLQSITSEVHPSRQKRLIWPSSWYRFPGRGVARTAFFRTFVRSRAQDMLRSQTPHHHRRRSSAAHVLILQLSALIDSDGMNTTYLEDPWTMLFNAQVFLQNMMLREILPRHGIAFLPLDVPWAEADLVRGDRRHYTRCTAADVDLERTAVVGEAFLTRMDYVLRYLE